MTESRRFLALLLPFVLCCGLARGQGPPQEPELGAWTKGTSIGGGWIKPEDLRQPPPTDREYEDIVAGRLSATHWGGLRTFRAPFRRPPNRFGRVHPAIKGLFFHVQVGGGVLTLFRIEARSEGAAKFVLRNFCQSQGSIPPGATKASERRGKVVVMLVLVPFPDADLGGALPVERYMFAPWLEDSRRQPDPSLSGDPLSPPSESVPPAVAQTPSPTESVFLRPEADAPGNWFLRVRAGARALYLANSERRSALTQFSTASPLLGLPPSFTTPSSSSDFDGFGYGLRLKAEGSWHGISPQLAFEALSVEGTEETRSADRNVAPRNDLLLTALTLDLAVGYRLEVSSQLTLVPSVGYTLDYQHHARSGLRGSGFNSFAFDLDGRTRTRADQRALGEGVSGGLSLEYTYDWRVALDLFLLYTHLYEVETKNDLTRAFSASGYLLRGGANLTYWLLPQVSIRLGFDLALRDVAKGSAEFAPGGALVRQPRSFTLWGGVVLGVQVKF